MENNLPILGIHPCDCGCAGCQWRLGQYAKGYLSPPQPSFTPNHLTDPVIIQRLEAIEKTLAEIENRLPKPLGSYDKYMIEKGGLYKP